MRFKDLKKIAVLLPVYKGDTAKNVSLAIRSIMRQSVPSTVFVIKDGEVAKQVLYFVHVF